MAEETSARQQDLSKTEKAAIVTERLVAHYGARVLVARRDPMHELISTILSHRTTHRNEEQAFHNLLDRFGTWEAVAGADVAEIEDAIRPATFPEAKAPRIREVTRRIIAERGAANLDFLAEMPLDEAITWLTALPGVGIKTATLLLLFNFYRPVIPVDSHLHRVLGRLGLIGPKTSANKAHDELLALLPPDPPLLFNFHKTMLRHGQLLCRWRDPLCERCPLTDVCDWYAANRVGGGGDGEGA